MDATFWLLLGAILVLLIGGLGVFRWANQKISEFRGEIATARGQIDSAVTGGVQNISNQVIAWAFTESEGEVDDTEHPGTKKKVRIRTPSPQFKELVGILVPEFVGQAVVLWREGKIQLSDVAKIPGATTEALKQLTPERMDKIGIPKEAQGILTLGIEFKDFIGKYFLGGNRGPPPARPGAPVAETKWPNPFLGR